MYDLKASNGILAEVNSHDIDAIRWFAGSEIQKLYAVGGNFRNPEAAAQYPDYYDSVLMSGTFQNGIQFVIDGAAYVQYGYDAKMELVGTKGVLHIGRSEADFLRVTTVENGTSTPFIKSWTLLFEEAYQAEDADFVQAILEDRSPAVTGMDGLMAVKVVQAGNQSIATGKIMEI
jgi:myo-inositol 2-dehydrogenase/D-chiro-inositol 1-dehydrogenase/scyllo-inositol 2-dehydrogenase (NAD+)